MADDAAPDWAAPEAPDWASDEKPAPSLVGALGQAVTNVPSSAVQFGKDIAQPFIHPVDTYHGVKNVGQGVLEKLGLSSGEEHKQYADAVGQFMTKRYGGWDNIKRTLAEDPVGVAADLSMLLTGGAGVAARVPATAGRAAEIAGTVGRAIDPINAAMQATKVPGYIAAPVIGGLTGAGEKSLKAAAKAGEEGGEASKAFTENLRGKAPPEAPVAEAQKAMSQLREQRGTAYEQTMAGVKANPRILDFDKVDSALTEASKIGRLKGAVKSQAATDLYDRAGKIVEEWKGYAPAQLHTPEGFDALKQRIGELYADAPAGSKQRVVVDKVYNSIKDTIVREDPKYAKIMNAYEKASTELETLQKELSLGKDVNPGTTLRKLQSVLRNNVNTAYNTREAMADFLTRNGAANLIPQLAGQALQPVVPRGLAKLAATHIGAGALGAAGAGLSGGALAAGAIIPFMSPRLMGEGAHLTGTGRRFAKNPLVNKPLEAARFLKPNEEPPFKSGGAVLGYLVRNKR